MALSLEYVAKETGNNLRRNVLMTTGAILCVAVSLTIVGIALVLKQGVSRATVAFVVVYVLRNVVFDLVKKQSIFNNLIASTHDVIGSGIASLIVGAVVGAGGSAAAVSRFLDV